MRTTSTLHEGIPRSSNRMNASSDVNPDFRHFKAHQLTSHYPLRNELKFIDRDSHWYTCRSHLNFTRANNINIYRNKAIEVTHLHKEHFWSSIQPQFKLFRCIWQSFSESYIACLFKSVQTKKIFQTQKLKTKHNNTWTQKPCYIIILFWQIKENWPKWECPDVYQNWGEGGWGVGRGGMV